MDRNIVLIGMPGCGKSTIAREVALKLDMKFIDMDEYIEECKKRTIKDMFKEGEDCFRDAESECASELSLMKLCVIATGGGIVKRKKNIDILKENSLIIFIDRPTENILKDIDAKTRPLLQNDKQKLHGLYEERIELYRAYSDCKVENKYSIESVVDEIITKMKQGSGLK